jgi:hypothetical protein
MSLEKSIQKLTQVIQAAQLYSAQAIVGGPETLERCTTETRGGQQMCVCVAIGADGNPIPNRQAVITPGPCKPNIRQVHDQDPDFVGPPKPLRPLPPLPPEPVDGWDCYLARKRMEEDPKNMKTCCFDPSTPVPHTKICYYRNNPGGQIQIRPENQPTVAQYRTGR